MIIIIINSKIQEYIARFFIKDWIEKYVLLYNKSSYYTFYLIEGYTSLLNVFFFIIIIIIIINDYYLFLYSNTYFSIQSFIKNRAIYSCILLLVSIIFIRKNTGEYCPSKCIILHSHARAILYCSEQYSPIFMQ
jgi:hypothetical protein